MNKLFFALLAAASVAAGAAETAAVSGTVNADLLNLRLGPGLQNPVVGKIADKTEVKIYRVVNNWVEIGAPENLSVYVSEARIGKDGVLSGELNMRTAMSVKAPCLGTLPKGTVVRKMDERRNGWVRIAVPESAGVRVYAAAFLVKYDPSKFDENGNVIVPGAEKTEKAAAAETPAPVKEKAAAAETPAPVKEKAAAAETPAPVKEKAAAAETPAPVKEKAAAAETPAPAKEEKAAPAVNDDVTLEGILTKWKFGTTKETSYVLLSAPNGFNLGFVFADDPALLSANENKKVKVSGKYTGRFGNNGAVIVKVASITVL